MVTCELTTVLSPVAACQLNVIVSPNLKWSFSMSTNRLQTGGYARQENGVLSLSCPLYESLLTTFCSQQHAYRNR